MASKQNSGKNDETATSADDIIDSLAKKMGVDEEEEATDAPAQDAGEDETSDALTSESADAATEDDADATPVPAPAPKKADDKKAEAKKKDGKKKDAKAAPALSMLDSAADNATDEEPVISNEESIAQIFTGTGEERTPRAVRIESDDETSEAPKGKGLMWFGIAAAASIGVMGVAYATLSEDRKKCLAMQFQQGDAEACVEYFNAIEEERIAEERRARLALAPKFGNLTVITEPKALRLVADGQEQLIFPGSRTDLVVPARSQLSFQNISVTEPFTFTIQGNGNFEDRTVVIPPQSDPTSPWVQNQLSGDYAATMTYVVCWPGSADVGAAHCLTPVADLAAELRWRSTYTPPADAAEGEITRLPGTITVTSNPPGAAIAYNNIQLYNEETGEPYVTPFTFSTYNAPRDREDRTPLPVYLTREGLPLTVRMEGKVNTTDGVYSHYFRCEPVPDAVAPAAAAEAQDWRGYCNYTYNVHLDLRDPPPPAAEGSGAEGSGAAAAAEGTGN